MYTRALLAQVCKWGAIALLAISWSASAQAQVQRPIYDDFDTQTKGSDHVGSLGPDAFGDQTDFYSGATTFLVTDVSLPGNSDLPVALQRSLKAYDDGMDTSIYSLPATFLTWTRFEVPYLSGIFKHNAGWVSTDLHDPTQQRCSITAGPPAVSQSSGKAETWEREEYWHGNHLVLPGGASQGLATALPTDPNRPSDGATYRWVTKENWYFSCLPTTQNGVAGEGFLAVAPDGKKYYFDRVVKWRALAALWKTSLDGDPTVLSRDEYRILVTRIEDRFGNWVTYAYSGNDLTTITANDGRQLTLSYVAPGGQLASVSDGARTWTYDYTSGTRVTHPDSSVWRSSVSGSGVHRRQPSGCTDTSQRYSGESIITIEHRAGAVGTFTFRPLRRGLSYVPYGPPGNSCSRPSKVLDGIALYSKAISGTGLSGLSWSYTYGPANDCYTNQSSDCTSTSPVTRYVDVSGPDNTFFRYTFGNKWRDTDGTLLSTETGSFAANILRNESLTWETFPAPGVVHYSAGDMFHPAIIRVPATRTITQNGGTYTTAYSARDPYLRPQTVTESGPNSTSRTTQYTYYNNQSKFVIGELASSSSPGRSMSRTFDANANVSSVTTDGVATSYTYHADGNVATITYPRSLVHSFSDYKRGIPQAVSQPEGINLSSLVSNAGFVTSQTDGEGNTRSYTRDPLGRVTSVDFPIGNDSATSYTGVTKSVRTTTRGSLVETVSYDALWRPTTVTRGGIATSYSYDADGRVTFESYPGGGTAGTHYAYDALGRVATITHSDSTYRSFQYGAASRTVRDERANYTTHAFRIYGDPEETLLMGITAPEPAANVGIVRAPNGLMTSITQAGLSRTFGYDVRNYLITETNPETGTTTYERDAAGNKTARIIGSTRADYSYDGQNRLSTTTYSDSTPAIIQTWSRTGKLRTASSSAALRTFGYDANDNLRSESLTLGSTVLTAQYAYNGNDQLSGITYPISQRVVSYTPDALGRPTQVSGYASAVTYWPSGQVRQIDSVNGMVTNYNQNSRLWPSTFSARRGSVYSISNAYGYDNAGNLTSVVDAVDGSMNRSLGYDGIDRLTTASGPWGTGTIGYDGAGNIMSQSLGSFSIGYSYDAQNRMSSVSGSRSASYSYDVFGNVSAAGGASYTYDAVPNLRCANCSGASRSDYTYDGLGNRVTVAKGGTTTYEFQGASGDLLVEYTPADAGKLVEHIYLGGKRIAQRVSDQRPPTSVAPTSSTVVARRTGGVTLAVNVGGVATAGTVTFVEAGNVIGTAYVINGQASIDVLGLALGSHTITATYSGDGSNSGNTVTFVIRVVNLDWLPAVLDLVLN